MPTHTRADEKFMMTHPDLWPQLFGLPVKKPSSKPGAFPECGCLLETATGEVRPIVYDMNIWAPKRNPAVLVEYPTWEALLDAGWIVD